MDTTDTPAPLSHYFKYVKPRLENDPVFREKYNKKRVELTTKKLARDYEYRTRQQERVKNRHRTRYAEDPEYKEKQKEKALARYYRLKALKSANVPENSQQTI
jgi:hypothetical protein